MPTHLAAQDRDANRQILGSPLPFLATKVVTFDGGTLNGVGDINGTNNPYVMFTVTGSVIGVLIAVGRTKPVGVGGNVQAGVPDFPDLLHATRTAADIDPQKIIVNNDMNYGGDIGHFRAFARNVILNVGGADVTSGVVEYYLLWRPLSADANVVAT